MREFPDCADDPGAPALAALWTARQLRLAWAPLKRPCAAVAAAILAAVKGGIFPTGSSLRDRKHGPSQRADSAGQLRKLRQESRVIGRSEYGRRDVRRY